ncbi:hypothetical protein H4R99_006166 [Coemansia sp. RSA 1722]|nr:hypothetical protein IWW45_008600 [Coemansia sp. RSA 485]KAJ2590036.1 hypothetical protein H4R99_007242 [Coemansia sp. RSA 1722]KAJ2593216.1 hypothetical protein H4R99_006166 [Coemansia sp. RSA 1722]KAJ2636137.1 hypothetical protein GGF40_003183 [Coemansia sp. RSA 1286]
MLMNDSPMAAAAMPVGMPFEPFKNTHSATLRYIDRQLIDDVAGEEIPADAVATSYICVSDLPASTKVVRPGMLWLPGMALPNDTLVVVVDAESIIKFVGCLEESDKMVHAP